jgi:hypothetical protein
VSIEPDHLGHGSAPNLIAYSTKLSSMSENTVFEGHDLVAVPRLIYVPRLMLLPLVGTSHGALLLIL